MQMYCPECRIELQAKSIAPTVCPNCGTPLSRLRSQPQDPATIPPLSSVLTSPDEPETHGESQFGRYRATMMLGSGSFGVVYKGYDEELQREVAIKVPHRQRISSNEDAEAYLAEARILASLDHPSIVPVYDVARAQDGRWCLVSKLVDGTDLRRQIMQTRPFLTESVQIVIRVAEALHHAHRRGLVHRDIKPANILVDSEGTPVVADFGLALRAEDFGKGPTLAGTPAYMSPEQARGEGHLVDARSDIYGLGVVFYELITGFRPFQSHDIDELFQQIKTLEPPSPCQVNPSIPDDLARICLKALSKPASERYLTALELAQELRTWLNRRTEMPVDLGGTLADRPQTSGIELAALRSGFVRKGRARRFRRMLGAAFLILVSGLTGSYILRERQPYERGMEAYRSGQYDPAVLYFNRALEVAPADARALFARGRAHLKGDNLHLALGDFLKASELRADGQTEACIGYCLSRVVQDRPAILHYRNAINAGFGPAEVFNDLGFSYLQISQLEQAQTTLNRAIELRSDLQAAFHNRTLVDLKKVAKNPNHVPIAGLQDIKKAIEIGPESADLYLNAGRLSALVAERDKVQLQLALDYIQKAIEHGLNPRDLQQDAYFRGLRQDSRFRTLTNQPAILKPPRMATRLINPVHDQPN